MSIDRIIFYSIFGVAEMILFFSVTIFYFNSKQNRQHEKELLEMQNKTQEQDKSIEENNQYIELLSLLKDYYK